MLVQEHLARHVQPPSGEVRFRSGGCRWTGWTCCPGSETVALAGFAAGTRAMVDGEFDNSQG